MRLEALGLPHLKLVPKTHEGHRVRDLRVRFQRVGQQTMRPSESGFSVSLRPNKAAENSSRSSENGG
jgi:hypothetical protein